MKHMERKQLRITISGSAGTGKTTMANVIAQALEAVGFDVTLEADPDGVVVDNLAERAANYLATRPKITVAQKATKRTAKLSHEWELIDVGMYDHVHKCKRCGLKWMESIDDITSRPPTEGCTPAL